MEKVYFATTNEQKLRQAQRVLGDTFDVKVLVLIALRMEQHVRKMLAKNCKQQEENLERALSS